MILQKGDDPDTSERGFPDTSERGFNDTVCTAERG